MTEKILEKNKILKIEGPAFVEVLEGKLSVLSKELLPKTSTVIPRSKVMVFKAVESSIINVRVGAGGMIAELDDILIPAEWRNYTSKILEMKKPLIIFVLGDVDSGKSTLCTYLANECFSRGLKTAIIDIDLGQSDIGPPTTLGLGFIDRSITLLSEVELKDAYFVGTVSPRNVIDRIILGSKKMLDLAIKDNREIIIFNTDGWVYGLAARKLKTLLLLCLAPDVIIALQRGSELEQLLKPFKRLNNINIIRLSPPKTLKIRSKAERKSIRQSMYIKYLLNAKNRVINFDTVGFLYSILGSGFPLSYDELKSFEKLLNIPLLYGETSTDSILLISKTNLEEELAVNLKEVIAQHTGKEIVLLLNKGFEKDLLVGLYGTNGVVLGLGIIREINFNKRTIELLTPVEEEIALIAIGSVKLTLDGKEIKKFYPWIF